MPACVGTEVKEVNTHFLRDCRVQFSSAFPSISVSWTHSLLPSPHPPLIRKTLFPLQNQLLGRFQMSYLTDCFSRLMWTSRCRNAWNQNYCFSSHWQDKDCLYFPSIFQLVDFRLPFLGSSLMALTADFVTIREFCNRNYEESVNPFLQAFTHCFMLGVPKYVQTNRIKGCKYAEKVKPKH